MHTDKYARALGWVSLALGAAQLTMPRTITRLSGLDDAPAAATITRLVGGRELLHAAMLLGGRSPAQWAWTRVAGDTMDLALLGGAMQNREGARRRRAGAALAVVSALTALDTVCAAGARRRPQGPAEVRASITVNRPRDEVYRFWRDLENLPAFMIHLESVRELDERRSRWQAKGLVWEAEITDERAGEHLVWGSARGSGVEAGGAVTFTDGPGGRGTVVDVVLRFGMPGGVLGAAVARLIGEHPEQQIRDDLRRFKQIMETGEVLRSEGSPEGTYAVRQRGQRPAQPVGGRP